MAFKAPKGAFDISALVTQGLEHKDDPGKGGGKFERWDPPAGWRGRVKVVRVNVDTQNDGSPRWGLWLEVADDGDDKGKRFWMNLKFSKEWAFINAKTVKNFMGFGISPAFLQQNGDNPEAIGTALEGKLGILTAGYTENKTGGKPWEDHSVVASKRAAVQVEDDDEDEDEDEDEAPLTSADFEDEDEGEEPPPPPAKKTRAKAKPAPEDDEDEEDDPAFQAPKPAAESKARRPRAKAKAAEPDEDDDFED